MKNMTDSNMPLNDGNMAVGVSQQNSDRLKLGTVLLASSASLRLAQQTPSVMLSKMLPSKQVNSFILPDDIIKNMKDKIKETKKLKIELGFALCIDKDNQINQKDNSQIIKDIKKGTDCVGTKCSIKVGKCEEDQIYIGNYHTHPRSHPSMSITDMVTGCSEDIECIGSAPFNTIRCFTRKTSESQCIEEIGPFEAEEHRILEKGGNIRSILKSPKTIVKTDIIKLLKDISQYETDIAKYHKNRFKLLNENFNRTDIS